MVVSDLGEIRVRRGLIDPVLAVSRAVVEKVICCGAAAEDVAFLAVIGLGVQASRLDRGCVVRRWILQKFAGVATALLRAWQR